MREFYGFQTVWERLQEEKRPIVLYGMGNGADKIRALFAEYRIKIAGIFASDEYVRGQSYAGFSVERLRDVVERLGEDIVIVVAFATCQPDVMARIQELDQTFDVVIPDVPVVGSDEFDREFVRVHADEIRRAYDLLADDLSRNAYENIIRFRLGGKLSDLLGCTTQKQEIFSTVLQPSYEEHYVDLGAYDGDTIRELLRYTGGQFRSIVALEPDAHNYYKLCEYVRKYLDGVVRVEQAGAWERDSMMPFQEKAGRQSAIATGGVMTPMRSLDSLLAGHPCTLIKMDIEGAEAPALRGARDTLRQYAPKLNIAAYHHSEDLFALPLLVHELQPAYRIYLRHHPYIPAWDTNLYARTDV